VIDVVLSRRLQHIPGPIGVDVEEEIRAEQVRGVDDTSTVEHDVDTGLEDVPEGFGFADVAAVFLDIERVQFRGVFAGQRETIDVVVGFIQTSDKFGAEPAGSTGNEEIHACASVPDAYKKDDFGELAALTGRASDGARTEQCRFARTVGVASRRLFRRTHSAGRRSGEDPSTSHFVST